MIVKKINDYSFMINSQIDSMMTEIQNQYEIFKYDVQDRKY